MGYQKGNILRRLGKGHIIYLVKIQVVFQGLSVDVWKLTQGSAFCGGPANASFRSNARMVQDTRKTQLDTAP
jgi:hypothetical protein